MVLGMKYPKGMVRYNERSVVQSLLQVTPLLKHKLLVLELEILPEWEEGVVCRRTSEPLECFDLLPCMHVHLILCLDA